MRLVRVAPSYVNGTARYAVHAGAEVTTPARCSITELPGCCNFAEIGSSKKGYYRR